MACEGFLVREACIGVLWVELDFFSVECTKFPVVSFEVSVGFV